MNNFFKKIKVGVCDNCKCDYEKTSPNQKYCINCQKGNHLKKDFFSFKEMKEIAKKYIKPRWEALNE